MVTALVYLRVSSRGQVEGDGLERQLIACQKYAAANGLEIAGIFREEGISGGSELENRPALQALYSALNDGETKTILIEKLDRLARDLMVQETLIADFKKNGILLVSTAEPDLCSDDPSRKLVRQIFGAIAEYDRAMIVLKLRGARQRQKSKIGRCEGRKPFGARPGESDVIKHMMKLKLDGHRSDEIACYLNIQAIPTRYGGPWHGGTVSKILKRHSKCAESSQVLR